MFGEERRNMSVYQCPVCGSPLLQENKSYCCAKRHTYDIARSGYVNLLHTKQQGKAVHGDNKLMVAARRDFLEQGFYAPLKDALCHAVSAYATSGAVILDAGCGEGYYTAAVADSLCKSGKTVQLFGVDISKTAVEFAAKRKKPISFCAASVFHLPVLTQSCDILFSLFSPYCGSEFQRVLRTNGYMILAIPGAQHLWELKQAVYDTPYPNEVKPYALEGFRLERKEEIHCVLDLSRAEDIRNLFSMTPYYYKTGRTEQERLMALDSLETQAEFELLIYQRDTLH